MTNLLNIGDLSRITETKLPNENVSSIFNGLMWGGAKAKLNMPHRLVQYLAQIEHESQDFKYDREVWGPTPAQKKYDTRTDLGNTAAVDGDGFKYRGHTAIQITGKANTAEFRDWCKSISVQGDPVVPDFVANPDLMNTDPWEGVGPIWFWMTRGLNRYADEGNIEMITRKINGGLNGYDDRCRRYTRIGLAMLGYNPNNVVGFQQDENLKADGIAGPRTRERIHTNLVRMDDLQSSSFGNPVNAIGNTSISIDIPVPQIVGAFKALYNKFKPKGVV